MSETIRVCSKFETMRGYHVSNLLTKDNQKSNEFESLCIYLLGALLHNARVTICLRCLLSKMEKSYKIVCTPVRDDGKKQNVICKQNETPPLMMINALEV